MSFKDKRVIIFSITQSVISGFKRLNEPRRNILIEVIALIIDQDNNFEIIIFDRLKGRVIILEFNFVPRFK